MMTIILSTASAQDLLINGTNTTNDFSSGVNNYGTISIGDTNPGASNNLVSVENSGVELNASGNLNVGNSGSANGLVISNGGQLFDATTTLGNSNTSSNNMVIVTDAGSLLSSSGDLNVGVDGSGNMLTVTNGGAVANGASVNGGVIGLNADSSNNMVLVTGTNSTWNNGGDLIVGNDGSYNSLVISNGAQVTNTAYNQFGGVLGFNADSSNNTVLVTGSNSTWNNQGDMLVGVDGSGNSLVISNGGTVLSSVAYLGSLIGENADSSNNTVLVTGTNSSWTSSGELIVGFNGSGNSLVISNGGQVFNGNGSYGSGVGDNGSGNSVVITGSGSTWYATNPQGFYIGGNTGANSNTLTIVNGGALYTEGVFIGNFGGGAGGVGNSALITGPGSTWTDTTSNSVYPGFFVGWQSSDSSLVISNGGALSTVTASIGAGGGSNDSVLITGAGSIWSNSADLNLGGYGTSTNYGGSNSSGTLTIAQGATLTTAILDIGADAGGSGVVNVGTLGGSDTSVTLTAPSIILGAGTGTLNFNQSDTTTISGVISGTNGTVNQLGTGTTILSGNSSSFSGTTTVSAGSLLVTGTLGGASLTVNGGVLGGTGTIGAVTTIQSGGSLTPGVAGSGALTFTNGLTLAAGSTTTFQINAVNNFTSINILGSTLTYGGALVFNITSYTPVAGDIFTLFNMTGSSESGDFSTVQLGSLFFTDNAGLWSGTNNGISYQFSDYTGQLIVTAVPEPSDLVAFGGLISAAVLIYRRRKARKD